MTDEAEEEEDEDEDEDEEDEDEDEEDDDVLRTDAGEPDLPKKLLTVLWLTFLMASASGLNSLLTRSCLILDLFSMSSRYMRDILGKRLGRLAGRSVGTLSTIISGLLTVVDI